MLRNTIRTLHLHTKREADIEILNLNGGVELGKKARELKNLRLWALPETAGKR
jgi:hypothetical protein